MRRPRRAERRAEMKKLETARIEHWECFCSFSDLGQTRTRFLDWNRTNPLHQAQDVRSHSGSVQFYSARRMEAPRTVDDVFDNFSARRDGLIKALTTGARSHRFARLGSDPKPARGREIHRQTFAFPVAIGSRRAGTRGSPAASEEAFAARAFIVSLTQILAHLR